MTSKRISIKKEVYKRLKKVKKSNESFSDIIESLLENNSNIQKILSSYGTAKSEDPEYEKIVLASYAKSRKHMQKSFNTKIKY